MGIVNNRYSGFNNYKELLDYINEIISYKEKIILTI